MPIQESRYGNIFRSPKGGPCCCVGGLCANARPPIIEKLTTRLPPAKKPRRDKVDFIISDTPFPPVAASANAPGGAPDCAHDAHMRAAPAEVRLHPVTDLPVGRRSILPQQGVAAHDHARNAVATLCGLLVDEGLLHDAGIFGRAQALE